jgi:hypothetical protein
LFLDAKSGPVAQDEGERKDGLELEGEEGSRESGAGLLGGRAVKEDVSAILLWCRAVRADRRLSWVESMSVCVGGQCVEAEASARGGLAAPFD